MTIKAYIGVAGILLAAVVLCYGGTTRGDFVWDDEFLVVNNPLVRAPVSSFAPFKDDIINSGFQTTIYYRPMQILSYAVDHRLWGMKSGPFHRTNVVIHFFNAFLVFVFTRRITKDRAISLAASVLFVVHPAFAGAVAYISGRADLLYFTFGFIFMLLFLDFTENKRILSLAGAVIALAAAFLSKEGALIFPLLAIAAEWMVSPAPVRRIKYHAIPMLLAGAYIYLHYSFLGARYSSVLGTTGVFHGALGYFRSLAQALGSGFFPVEPLMRRSGTEWYDIAGGIVFLFLLAGIWISGKRRRTAVFAAAFFVLAMIPLAFVGPYFGVFAEHWMYLSGYGLFLLTTVFFADMFEMSPGKMKYVPVTALFCLTAFYSVSSISSNTYWASSKALSSKVLSGSPADVPATYFRSLELVRAGENKEAREVINRYASMEVRDPRAFYVKGRIELSSGNDKAAEMDFKTAISLDPSYGNGYFGLALVNLSRGEREKGMELLQKAILKTPRNTDALLMLGTIYLETGDTAKSVEYTERAYAQDPYSYDAIVNLGSVYTRSGDPKRGAVLFLKAAELYPERPVPAYNLGYIFARSGDKEEAIRWLKKALAADPDFMPAKELLGNMD
ncbi:MAG: tetratricopeptide repeat protein [Candidatus Omnitrophica bacterium]|nr:tetratricopeptide repeat protein [Candidatus Omnitrophota bacterium]